MKKRYRKWLQAVATANETSVDATEGEVDGFPLRGRRNKKAVGKSSNTAPNEPMLTS